MKLGIDGCEDLSGFCALRCGRNGRRTCIIWPADDPVNPRPASTNVAKCHSGIEVVARGLATLGLSGQYTQDIEEAWCSQKKNAYIE